MFLAQTRQKGSTEAKHWIPSASTGCFSALVLYPASKLIVFRTKEKIHALDQSLRTLADLVLGEGWV